MSKPGTGFVSKFATRPDPWAVMASALGVAQVEIFDIHIEPSDKGKIEDLARRYDVTQDQARDALARARVAHLRRYGTVPPGTSGATVDHPPCELHGGGEWRDALRWAWETNRWGTNDEFDGQWTPVELQDCQWGCPTQELLCPYFRSQWRTGGTPDNPRIIRAMGRAPGEKWTETTGHGCTIYMQQVGATQPPPAPAPKPKPEPPPPPIPPPPAPPQEGRATPRERAREWHETLGALIQQAKMPKWAPRLWWLGREPFLVAAEALIAAKRRALEYPEEGL